MVPGITTPPGRDGRKRECVFELTPQYFLWQKICGAKNTNTITGATLNKLNAPGDEIGATASPDEQMTLLFFKSSGGRRRFGEAAVNRHAVAPQRGSEFDANFVWMIVLRYSDAYHQWTFSNGAASGNNTPQNSAASFLRACGIPQHAGVYLPAVLFRVGDFGLRPGCRYAVSAKMEWRR